VAFGGFPRPPKRGGRSSRRTVARSPLPGFFPMSGSGS
jgi:hypothetical protein